MKYIIEVDSTGITRKFVDDEGNAFFEKMHEYPEDTPYEERLGSMISDGKALSTQLEEAGEYDEELVEAIDCEDIDQIYECLRDLEE